MRTSKRNRQNSYMKEKKNIYFPCLPCDKYAPSETYHVINQQFTPETKATNSLMQPFVFIFYYILVTFFYYIRQRIVKEKICPDAMGKTYLKKQI